MSDLLSGLEQPVASGNWTAAALPSALAYNSALDDVRDILLNPPDELVRSVTERARLTLGIWITAYEVRAVLAAAAGRQP